MSSSSDSSSELLQRLREFDGTSGLERSVKFTNNAILTDRWLVTFSGDLDREVLLTTCHDYQIHDGAFDQLCKWLPEASLVHIGCEADSVGAVVKVYCELPIPPQQDLPCCNFRAVKWNPSFPADYFISEYHYHGLASSKELHQLIADTLDQSPDLQALAHEIQCLVEQATVRSFPARPRLLIVTEPSTNRLSIDLNVYDSQIRMDECDSLWSATCSSLSLSRDQLKRITTGLGSQQLGHLAVGNDRTGTPFLTVYYGVSDLAANCTDS